jgi:type I restriction enzyme R subunit
LREVKYWNHVSDSELDSLVVNLAPLMKYREELSPKQQAKYDFEDIIKEKEFVEFGADRESVSITKYKEMVENKIVEINLQKDYPELYQAFKNSGRLIE